MTKNVTTNVTARCLCFAKECSIHTEQRHICRRQIGISL